MIVNGLRKMVSMSHRDSTLSEVYCKVQMTRVLHTARISNVDSVTFVNGIRKDGETMLRTESAAVGIL